MRSKIRAACLIFIAATQVVGMRAEDGSAAWLRYAAISHPAKYQFLPSRIAIADDTPGAKNAARELQRGLSSMLQRPFAIESYDPAVASIRITAQSPLNDAVISSVEEDGFRIARSRIGNDWAITLSGNSPRAELYAAFHLLAEIGEERTIPDEEEQAPSASVRWVDEWDNPDGSIERGYAGRSIFFDGGHVRADLTRAGDYARILASVGIDGCNINNVNADLQTLSSEHLREFAKVADAFRPWGVRLSLSIDLSSPQTVGRLNTFDPLDPRVIEWWHDKIQEIYGLIPDFAGFTVKADSEGRVGPSQYGRTPADAANLLARALQAHGGIVLYRGFVYNNHLDWRDRKADRARAGYDNFAKLDGKFEPNVIIQIKHGPIDFQVREPISPLFAALQHTNTAVELQTTQEYTGQQRHMVWLVPKWKWALDTDMRVQGRSTPVKEIVEGKSFDRPVGGFVSVVNVGLDANWLHHSMAMANLYGYGRLAWNPDEPAEQIIDEWTRLTWGNDARVDSTIDAMQLASWHNYENYTGPNGMGTLTDILGYHFGPGIESAEHNGWGMWFRAEKDGIGMDRTVATGTGYIGQYPAQMAERYESLATCPDDLLLFFHHVPYDYKLHSGKTLVQSIYDSHYAGALAAAQYVVQWNSLRGLIDPDRYKKTLDLFTYQAGHALVWRDAINAWFQQTSGIKDGKGRVGHDPFRIEAEDMKASGYVPVDVQPWETASGGKAVICHGPQACALSTVVHRPAGEYDVAVQYFDLWGSISRYDLQLNGKPVARWAADDTLPPAQPDPHLDGQDSTRFTAHKVRLKPGDLLELHAVPGRPVAIRVPRAQGQPVDVIESAPVDYIEIGPNGLITPQ